MNKTEAGRRVRAAVILAVMTCGWSTTSRAAPVWWKDIPDAFQHQRWGAPPGSGIVGANDANGDGPWETNSFINPPFPAGPFFGRNRAIGAFGGWCNIATYTNQLYHFQQNGFDAMTAAVNNVDHLHNEVKALALTLAAVGGAPGQFTRNLNAALGQRRATWITGAVGRGGRAGLIAQNYRQDGNNVSFNSSVPNHSKRLPKSTLFDHLPTIKGFGDTVNLRLSYNGNPGVNDPQRALWWRGAGVGSFHSVAVAGYDNANNGTIFFADPDSNPTGNGQFGNKNDNAGWDVFAIGTAAASDQWLGQPNNNIPVKQRRFAAGGAVPKPANDPPTQAQIDKLYFPGTLAANKKQFSIADNDYKRYDTVGISFLETLEVVKAGNRPQIPFGPGDDPFIFEVSPGLPDSGPDPITRNINEFLLSPASSDEEITGIFNLRVNNSSTPSMIVGSPTILNPGVWNIYFYGENEFDPYGNELPYGGVSIRAGAGVSALSGLDLLDFEYVTAGNSELSAWDFLYNDYNDNPCDDDVFQLCYESLGVQTFSDAVGYDLETFQTPEPGTLTLLALAVTLLTRRRR